MTTTGTTVVETMITMTAGAEGTMTEDAIAAEVETNMIKTTMTGTRDIVAVANGRVAVTRKGDEIQTRPR